MSGFDSSGVRRVLLGIGVLVVAGLWTAEEAGWIHMAGTEASEDDADLPPPAAEALGLVAQGAIVGNGKVPGVAILSDNGRAPEMVSEGQAYHEDLRVERVLADRVILRQRDSNAPVVLAVVAPSSPPRQGEGSATPAVPGPAESGTLPRADQVPGSVSGAAAR